MINRFNTAAMILGISAMLTACGGGGDDGGDGGDGNTAPVAIAQTLNVTKNTSITIKLEGSDADGDALTFVHSTPSRGTITETAPDLLTYTPELDYEGNDSFSFTVNDGTTDSAPATISLVISTTAPNNAPSAYSQSVTTEEDTDVAITLTAHDPDGDTLTYDYISNPPTNGSLGGTAPNLTYTPNTGFSGSDSFTFTVNDGTDDSAAATVSISVTPVNDAPTADPQNLTTDEDVALTITLTASDPDGDTLTYTVNNPTYGSLSGTPSKLTYTPDAHYNGSDSFTFSVNDGSLDSNVATVTITVNPQPDPPESNTPVLSINEDAVNASITLSGVDPDGDPISYSLDTNPANGVLGGTEPNLTYSPNANFDGVDSFNFIMTAGTDNVTATVYIVVSPINDAPVGTDAVLNVIPNTPTNGNLGATDVDSSVFTYAIVDSSVNGTISNFDPSTGAFTYTLNSGSTDSFTFSVTDDHATDQKTSAIATVTINTSLADAPSPVQALSGDQRVTLDWAPVANAESYNIYWSTTPGAGTGGTLISNVQPPYFHVDDGLNPLSNDTPYYYVVTSVNAVGESLTASSEISATPAAILLTDVLLTISDTKLASCVSTTYSANGWTEVNQLTYLECTGSTISQLNGIEALTSLAELHLTNNSISDISPLIPLTNLTNLSLHSNSISDIAPLSGLTRLFNLGLADNNISDISPISALSSLQVLYLSNNNISTLSDIATGNYFANLSNLRELYLDANRISDVSPLSGVTSLFVLTLDFNSALSGALYNVHSLTALTNTPSGGLISLSGNVEMSCADLDVLLAALGSPPVNVDGDLYNSGDTSIPGTNCTQ